MADASVVFTTDLDEAGIRSGLGKLKSSIGTYAKGALIALGAVGAGLGAIAKTALSYNSQMEQYMTSFTTLLGSEEKAAAKMAELKEYAAATPFEMTDLANATKMILGFGVAEDKTSVAMKQLGDISQGNSERFSALALVYGQMASTGKLMGQDLLQMINAGFNPLTTIAQKTGASMADLKKQMAGEKTSDAFKKMIVDAQAEVKKLGDGASQSAKMLAEIGTSGQISAGLVEEAMKIATSEGGLFYGAMEKQSKTAAGLISTLKDNTNMLLGDVFAGASEALKQDAIPAALGYVQTLTDALKSGGPTALMDAFGSVMGDVASKGATFAPSFITMAVGVLKAFLAGIKSNSKMISAGLMLAFLAALQGIIELAPELADMALALLLGMGDALAAGLPDVMSSLVDTAFKILVRLVANAPRIMEAGAKLAKALVLGMMGALVTLMGDFWEVLVGGANQKMNSAIDAVRVNIRPEVSEADAQAMTDAINRGIEAAKDVTAIKVEVDTNLDAFSASIDAAFADDKFTKKELKGLQSTLNAQVDDAVAKATENVEKKREEYKQTLLTLVDDKGQPVYTEAAANTIADAMTAKTKELTGDLDKARGDLNDLLNTIYAGKTDPTQAQIDNINALLEQIGVLEVKLGTLQNQAVQVATAKTERVKRGEGTTEDFGVAIGFTGEMYKQDTADIEAGANERLAALQAVAEADDATAATIDGAYAQMNTVYNEKAAAQKTAAQAYNDEMIALYNGMATKYPDAAKTIANISDLSSASQKITELSSTLGTMNEFDPEQVSSFMEQLTTMYTDFYGMDIPAGDMDRLLDPFSFAAAASELLTTFSEDIAGLIESNSAGLKDNPLLLYLQTMLDNGNFDSLDVTKVDGALKSALELVNFEARGMEAGGQLVQGVDGGIGYAAANLSDENVTALREAMLKMMRDVFGIHSPAASMFPIGENLVDGIAFSMTQSAWKLDAVGAFLVMAIALGMLKNKPLVASAIQSVISSAAAHASMIASANGFAVGAALGAGVIAGILSQAGGAAAAAAALVAITNSASSSAAASGSGSLLGRVQRISGAPTAGKVGGNVLNGSVLGNKASVVTNNQTVQFTQQVTFESTIQAPDEVARAMRKQAAYGLAGVRV